MLVKDVLNDFTPNKYFILDSRQDTTAGHNDHDYVFYSYNKRNFNQLRPNSFFLYRRPGNSSHDKKFHIFGGGIIESISEPDVSGDVIARIKKGFRFVFSIDQGTEFIEQFNWTTRQKPGPGWKGFWLNYGMNEITGEDFWNLIKNRECILIEGESINEELEQVSDDITDKDFEIKIEGNTKKVKKINFEDLNRRKKNIGTLGELIVLSYENQKLKENNVGKIAEHVSDTIGDGLGYDIKSYDLNGDEIHIEVKTTKGNMADSFYMSNRELEESKNHDYKYKIYRVYNLNEALNRADIIIYDGEISEQQYKIEPVSYLIKNKE